MKTPKRYIEIAPFEFDPTDKKYPIPPEHVLEQRFKRKNRIAQLKRSLSKYKGGEFLPWYTYERHAYMLMQKLRRPSDDADCIAHNEYTRQLFEVVKLINQAVEASGFRAGKAWQMKYGKEEQR